MTANCGEKRGLSSDINVTPMIDVLLVLLIIFMLIVPMLPKGEAASVPQPAKNDGRLDAVILELTRGAGGEAEYKINQQQVARLDLPAKVAEIFANRNRREMFVKADGGLAFTKVAEAIDTVRSAGVDRVGLLTPAVEAGR
jgi:biopolymer transport protein TolR